MAELDFSAPSDPDRFTTRELIEEAQREVEMRRRVYGKQIRAGRMDRKEADERIDKMTAIVRRLTKSAGMFAVLLTLALGGTVVAHAALSAILAAPAIAAEAKQRAAW